MRDIQQDSDRLNQALNGIATLCSKAKSGGADYIVSAVRGDNDEVIRLSNVIKTRLAEAGEKQAELGKKLSSALMEVYEITHTNPDLGNVAINFAEDLTKNKASQDYFLQR